MRAIIRWLNPVRWVVFVILLLFTIFMGAFLGLMAVVTRAAGWRVEMLAWDEIWQFLAVDGPLPSFLRGDMD